MATHAEHLERLEQVEADMNLDFDGIRVLIGELKKTEDLNDLDPDYIKRVVQSVNSSLARHLVALNELVSDVDYAKKKASIVG